MGGAVKAVTNTVSAVVAPVVAPVVSVTQSVAKATGAQDLVKNNLGIDINNMAGVAGDTVALNGSTGSSKFKNAAFDAAKVGVIASTGGAASGAALGYGEGAAALIGLSKVQAGKPLSIGDIAGAGGYGTTFESPFGDFNFGDIKLPTFGSSNSGSGISGAGSTGFLGGMTGSNSGSSNSILILGAGLVAIVAVFLIVRRK